jgi:hypothetical protein
MNVKNSVGLIVSGLLALVVYVYPDEVKQILNNLLSFAFHVPAGDAGYYLVLSVFIIAFFYFVTISLLSFWNWFRRRRQSGNQPAVYERKTATYEPEPDLNQTKTELLKAMRFFVEHWETYRKEIQGGLFGPPQNEKIKWCSDQIKSATAKARILDRFQINAIIPEIEVVSDDMAELGIDVLREFPRPIFKGEEEPMKSVIFKGDVLCDKLKKLIPEVKRSFDLEIDETHQREKEPSELEKAAIVTAERKHELEMGEERLETLNEKLFKPWKEVSISKEPFHTRFIILDSRLLFGENTIELHSLSYFDAGMEFLSSRSDCTSEILEIWKKAEDLKDEYNEIGEQAQKKIHDCLLTAYPSLQGLESLESKGASSPDCYLIGNVTQLIWFAFREPFLKDGKISWESIIFEERIEEDMWKLTSNSAWRVFIQSRNQSDVSEKHFKKTIQDLLLSISEDLKRLDILQRKITQNLGRFREKMNALTVDIDLHNLDVSKHESKKNLASEVISHENNKPNHFTFQQVVDALIEAGKDKNWKHYWTCEAEIESLQGEPYSRKRERKLIQALEFLLNNWESFKEHIQDLTLNDFHQGQEQLWNSINQMCSAIDTEDEMPEESVLMLRGIFDEITVFYDNLTRLREQTSHKSIMLSELADPKAPLISEGERLCKNLKLIIPLVKHSFAEARKRQKHS